MYLDYATYQAMGGTLSNPDFNFYAYEAESYIDWYTFNRLKGQTVIPQEVKDCEFYLIRLVQSRMDSLGISAPDPNSAGRSTTGQIMSMSNDGVSTSYGTMSAKDAISAMSDEIGSAIKRHLQGVTNELGRKLLYRGLYPNE